MKYHSKIIGRKGGVVRKLRTDYDVQIQVPSQDSEGKSENPAIILTGYEENCLKAKAAIHEMVAQLVSDFLSSFAFRRINIRKKADCHFR